MKTTEPLKSTLTARILLRSQHTSRVGLALAVIGLAACSTRDEPLGPKPLVPDISIKTDRGDGPMSQFNPKECPVAKPDVSSSCSIPATVDCYYYKEESRCNYGPKYWHLRCEAGKWALQPDHSSDDCRCPEEPPANGSTCPVPGAAFCSFPPNSTDGSVATGYTYCTCSKDTMKWTCVTKGKPTVPDARVSPDGRVCPPLPSCNWCGAKTLYDPQTGCATGYGVCANGAHPCTTTPCSAQSPCKTGEQCGADRLCWPKKFPDGGVASNCSKCAADEVCVQGFDGNCLTGPAVCKKVSAACLKEGRTAGYNCRTEACEIEFCGAGPYYGCLDGPPCGGKEDPLLDVGCYGP